MTSNTEYIFQPETHQNVSDPTFSSDQLVLGRAGNSELPPELSTLIKNDNKVREQESDDNSSGDGLDGEDSHIDFSDDSNLSQLDEIDQQIFASARAGKITVTEAISLLSSKIMSQSRGSDVDDDDDTFVNVFCPFSFDMFYTPKKYAILLKSIWQCGIETHGDHMFERGSNIGLTFSSVSHANRFLKFCCAPRRKAHNRTTYQRPPKLDWNNLVNIRKKWKTKIKAQLSKNYTALRLIIHISFPKSDFSFVLNQLNAINNPF
jgi:hypothetical protein